MIKGSKIVLLIVSENITQKTRARSEISIAKNWDEVLQEKKTKSSEKFSYTVASEPRAKTRPENENFRSLW